MTLNALGFDDWFEARALPLLPEGCRAARVVAVNRGGCLVRTEAGEFPAEPCGRLLFQADGPEDLPCVGDWVALRLAPGDAAAIIQALLPRRTLLRRRAAGAHGGEVQPIAANVDVALLAQACGPDFNPCRLERYLAMAAEAGVEPLVLLTKADLAGPEELERLLAALARVSAARVLALSCADGRGLAELRGQLAPGRTFCLLGSSGVGKTTLLNRLLGREALATAAVSGTGEGRHTTTRRQLLALEGGALLVDTPGMRELGVLGLDNLQDGAAAGFAEIAALAAGCRFADCRHEGEPGCAVLAAARQGELEQERLANYRKLRGEAEFHALSRRDRREKDRAFGRLVRAVKKNLR